MGLTYPYLEVLECVAGETELAEYDDVDIVEIGLLDLMCMM